MYNQSAAKRPGRSLISGDSPNVTADLFLIGCHNMWTVCVKTVTSAATDTLAQLSSYCRRH